jgi:hypothetical protein
MLQINELVASQPRYGEGGEAIEYEVSCSSLALSSSLPHYCDIAQVRRYFSSSITGISANPIYCNS